MSPYVYYEISGRIQYDNINYDFAIDQTLNRYGNVPIQGVSYDGSGAAAFPYRYYVESPIEGQATLTFSAFSVPRSGSSYPNSLPDVTINGVNPDVVNYYITYVFAEYSPSSESFNVSPLYGYSIELPEIDIAEAYNRFCNDESPVFPSDDTVVIVTGISCDFEAVGDISITCDYPLATDILTGFPNIEIVPDIDVDSIIEEAYQAGVQAGFHEGWEQGYNALEEFNPGQWLLNIVEGVFTFKILPIGGGITVGMILAVLIVVPFAIWFLRLFAGG